MSLIINPYSFGIAYSGILDTYSGASVAYSVRKLDKDYSGSAIRVRRSSDDSESDIGFDSSGNLDESALTSFIGANSAYVTTWYDQSGNSRNATQTTTTRQPRIVNAGTLDTLSNKPALVFGTYTASVGSSSNLLTGDDTPASAFAVAASNNNGNTSNLFTTSGTNGIVANLIRQSSNNLFFQWKDDDLNTVSFSKSGATNLPQNTRKLIQVCTTGTAVSAYLNDSSSAEFSQTYNLGYATLDNNAAIGSGFTMQEFILYVADKSSDRTGIRDNINSYFGVY